MSGIPYMGGKRGIARDLVTTMLTRHPDATHVYDLFGGGGAMSLEFARRGLHVTYNDKDRAIASLFRHLATGGDLGEWATRWVSREEFHALRRREDWVGGFVQSVWSFGNCGRSYLYSDKNAEIKRALHDICIGAHDDDTPTFGIDLEILWAEKQVRRRRLLLMSEYKRLHGHEQLAELERVETLERIGVHENITVADPGSYDAIDATRAGSIIYLDPPYEDTGGYVAGGICYDALHAWIMTHELPVYVSSYEWPRPGLVEVWAREKIVSMQGGSGNSAVERLFANPVAVDTATFGLVPP